MRMIKKLLKNKKATASPIEFSFAALVMISTFTIVTASIGQQLIHDPLEDQVDVQSKAAEIANILMTSDSQIGLKQDSQIKEQNSAEKASLSDMPMGPDLKILNSISYTLGETGDSIIQISFDVQNLNSVVADGFEYWIRISDKPASDGVYEGPIEQGETISMDTSKTIYLNNFDLIEGYYYHLKILITTSIDTDINNNIATKQIILPQPPNSPTITSGPHIGFTGQELIYKAEAFDPDDEYISYKWDYGDGTTSDWSNYKIGPDEETYIWDSAGTYKIKAKARDDDGHESGWSDPYTVEISVNNPPDKPSNIVEEKGMSLLNSNYTYSTSSTDPDGDKIKYGWDWDGDGNIDEYDDNDNNYYESGATVSTNHKWRAYGTYDVRVKAIDNHSYASVWSNKKIVVITPSDNNPPDAPHFLEEPPSEANTGESITFTVVTNDPDGDNIKYGYDWQGDGFIDEWDPNTGEYYASGSISQMTHTYTDAGEYTVHIYAEDELGYRCIFRLSHSMTIIGHIDGTVAKPSGQTNINPNEAYEYTTSYTGPENPVKIEWDWGDETTTTTDNVEPGKEVTTSNSWSSWGNYDVKARAIGGDGKTSDWSETLTVNVIDPSNNPPTEIIFGSTDPTELEPGQIGEFEAQCTEIDYDSVTFYWDWTGNQVEDESSEGYPRVGTTVYSTASHSWDEEGTYYIYVKAKDDRGGDSGWSNYLTVIVKRGGIPIKCFKKETKILMADDTEKNIEEIKIGDKVKSYDIENKKITTDIVTDTYHDTKEQMTNDFYLIINEKIGVTSDHPILINDKWVQAKELKIGDKLAIGEIKSIEKIYKRIPTYNFETSKYHNYIVKTEKYMAIAHNGESNYYVLNGYEEGSQQVKSYPSTTRESSDTVLSMDKIRNLAKIESKKLKSIFDLPLSYDFIIKIKNDNMQFLYKSSSAGISEENGQNSATHIEDVVIKNNGEYIFANLEITVISY